MAEPIKITRLRIKIGQQELSLSDEEAAMIRSELNTFLEGAFHAPRPLPANWKCYPSGNEATLHIDLTKA